MARPRQDLQRELDKVLQAVNWVVSALQHEAEHNAAMHMNERVLYPPATSNLMIAQTDLIRIIEELGEEES